MTCGGGGRLGSHTRAPVSGGEAGKRGGGEKFRAESMFDHWPSHSEIFSSGGEF
jgi:hypothetical protein